MGILTGSKQGNVNWLLPRDSATRAQGARMLMVFSQEVMNK